MLDLVLRRVKLHFLVPLWLKTAMPMLFLDDHAKNSVLIATMSRHWWTSSRYELF
jgi:hypothetical protein